MGMGRQGWCRLVTAAYNYFHVTNFFWMFGEGCYLHTAIVLTYSTDRLRKWMFVCIGWGERAPRTPAAPASLPAPHPAPSRLWWAPQPSAPTGGRGQWEHLEEGSLGEWVKALPWRPLPGFRLWAATGSSRPCTPRPH